MAYPFFLRCNHFQVVVANFVGSAGEAFLAAH